MASNLPISEMQSCVERVAISLCVVLALTSGTLTRKCTGFSDVVFILDDSASTRRSNPFNPSDVVWAPGLLELMSLFISNSQLDADTGLRFQMLAYSTTTRPLTPLTADGKVLREALASFTPQFMGSNTGHALRTARSSLISHARAGAARHVVIFTDGPANDPQIVAMEAPWLQSVASVISVAFDAGSTPPISLEEQFSIAGDVNRMFRVNSDNELPGLFDEIAFLISGNSLLPVLPVKSNVEVSPAPDSLLSLRSLVSTVSPVTSNIEASTSTVSFLSPRSFASVIFSPAARAVAPQTPPTTLQPALSTEFLSSLTSPSLPSTSIKMPASPVFASPILRSQDSTFPSSVSPISVSPASVSPISASPASVSQISVSPASASPISVSPASASLISVSPASASSVSVTPVSASPISPSSALSVSLASAIPVSPASASPISVSPASASVTSVSPASALPISVSPVSASPISVSPTSASLISVSPTSSSAISLGSASTSPLPVSPATASPVSASPTPASPVSASSFTASIPTFLSLSKSFPLPSSLTSQAAQTFPGTLSPSTPSPSIPTPSTPSPLILSSTLLSLPDQSSSYKSTSNTLPTPRLLFSSSTSSILNSTTPPLVPSSTLSLSRSLEDVANMYDYDALCSSENSIGYYPYISDPAKFVQCTAPGSRPGYVVKNCAFNTVWSSEAVACAHAYNIPKTPSTRAFLSINFQDGTIQDDSINMFFLQLLPSPAYFTFPDKENVLFSGLNYIFVPGLANKDFRDKFMATVSFTPIAEVIKNQVLLHNRAPSDNADSSIKIQISDSVISGKVDVSFLVITSEDRLPAPIVLTAEKGTSLDVQMLYDGTEVLAKVFSSDGMLIANDSRAATGVIEIWNGFTIGAADRQESNNFIGMMNLIQIFDSMYSHQ